MDFSGISGTSPVGTALASSDARLAAPGMDSPVEPVMPLDRISIGAGEKRDAEPKLPGQKAALSAEDHRIVAELQKRDREVRDHEAAHSAAGGSMAGAPAFTYESGPDGRMYAIGGEVRIDLTPGRTPEETIARARRIRAAALAPADPSGQDLSVASAASAMEMEALREKALADKTGQSSPTAPVANRAGATLRVQPGGSAHLHSSDGCGACAKGVAYYRNLARLG